MRSGRVKLRTDEGFTYIEVLISLALVSIAFVAILTAVDEMVVAGTAAHKVTTSESVVRTLAEYVKSETSNPYTPCNANPLSAYQTKASVLPNTPTGYTPTVVSVFPLPTDTATPTTFITPGCPPGGDTGVQLVTVQVQTTAVNLTQTLAVVKRNPAP
jgi:prepilin-type N-terminal cleavage/methylation domain-containing protein